MSDPNKPDLSLIPIKALEDIAIVFQKGLKNGRKRNDWMQLQFNSAFAAMLRHAGNCQYDTDDTDEDGVSHVASMATNAIICLYLSRHTHGTQHDHSPKNQNGQCYPDGFRGEPQSDQVCSPANIDILHGTKERSLIR